MRIFLLGLALIFLFSCAEKKHYHYHSKCPSTFKGLASYYGKKFHGRRTASGEIYNMYKYTAAHRYLPFGTILLVKNLKNGRTVKVRINDRGPFVRGRVIDLSYAAAKKLRMLRAGVVPVIVRVLRCGR
ncbi:septal ring lytic transglycosylase RlpA family protein [Persephonella sp.]|uniref:septal ring lytic transglycosylase RlpA family protein n=1 Tax=Persephonella sp. TaxID=2060922 RepID=UPI00260C0BB5|nr:septal ring lytic transglycosylase RlpA family protein [Persephonella sp.]